MGISAPLGQRQGQRQLNRLLDEKGIGADWRERLAALREADFDLDLIGFDETELDEIMAGRFSMGDRLPTENQLAQRFSVSRPVVREALQRLHHPSKSKMEGADISGLVGSYPSGFAASWSDLQHRRLRFLSRNRYPLGVRCLLCLFHPNG